jgi:hypothetical protein
MVPVFPVRGYGHALWVGPNLDGSAGRICGGIDACDRTIVKICHIHNRLVAPNGDS